MNNFDVVFLKIKEHCRDADIPDKTCFEQLKKMYEEDNFLLPVYCYLEVLQVLGLIKFDTHSEEITLTGKGMEAESVFSR